MKYIEFDHPIIRGIFENYRQSDIWTMIIFTIIYGAIIIATLSYIYVRRKEMTVRRWLYSVGGFCLITGLFLASMIIPGHLKSGYYEGDVEVQRIVPITDAEGKQYGIIPKNKIQPKQIQGLIVDKKTLKHEKVKDGDTIHIKTEPRYKPKKTTSYVIVDTSDIKNVKKGH